MMLSKNIHSTGQVLSAGTAQHTTNNFHTRILTAIPRRIAARHAVAIKLA